LENIIRPMLPIITEKISFAFTENPNVICNLINMGT